MISLIRSALIIAAFAFGSSLALAQTAATGTVVVEVYAHKREPLPKAEVTLEAKGKGPTGKIQLSYDQRMMAHVASGVPPGTYLVRVSMGEMLPDEREVVVGYGLVREPFFLGKKGSRSYYRGRVRMPVDAPADRIAVSLRPTASENEVQSFRVLLRNLKLELDRETPEQVRQEGVIVLRVPNVDNGQNLNRALQGLSQEPAVRLAGRVVHIGDRTISFLTNQIIVRFKASVRDADVSVIARRRGLRIVRNIPYAPNAWLMTTGGVGSFEVLDICDALVKSGDVIYAEPNLVETAEDQQVVPTDFLFPEQWHAPLVNLPNAWQTLRNENAAGVSPGDPGDLTFGSEDIVIAILDRGIQSNTVGGVTTAVHGDFAGNVTGGASKVAHFYDFATMAANNDAPPNDHGMGCASVAAARSQNACSGGGMNEGGSGAAPNCRLIGAIRPTGGTNQQYADAFVWLAGFNPGWTVDGVNYLAGTVFPGPPTNPADVISCSFFWSTGALAGVMSDTFDYVTTYGRDGRGTGIFWIAGNYPAMVQVSLGAALYPKVMTVGASTLANDGVTEVRAAYSAIGNSVEFCTPSHDAYVGGAALHNPPANYGVISADLLGGGNMPGCITPQTTLSGPAVAGAGTVTLDVASSAGFAVGQAVLIGTPGVALTEAQMVQNIPSGTQIDVPALNNAHPAGTPVAGGPADHKNNFGGTSSATPLAAGIAALCLSINPELSWVELRQILRNTATQIDLANTTATGQWVDTTGDTFVNFSQWYGWGRLNANAAVAAARDYDHESDVVVRENLTDNGSVPSGGWHAKSPDIWADPDDVPIPAIAYGDAPPHKDPIRGQDNYLFVRVKNVGTLASSDFWVRGLITHYPGFEFRYPEEWIPSNVPGTTPPSPLARGSYLIDEVNIASLAAGDDQILKMTWPAALVPDDTVMVGGISVKWHPCLLAEVAPHDGPAPTGSALDVKSDNNLAQRNIAIDDPDDSSDTGDAFAVVAGTSSDAGVDAVLVDRSLVSEACDVFIRIADEDVMNGWLSMVDRHQIPATGGLAGVRPAKRPSHVPGNPQNSAKPCGVTLLDSARIAVDCKGDCGFVIHAAAGTKLACEADQRTDIPKLHRGVVQGKDVIVFGKSSPGVELPLRLGRGQYVPLIFGFIRSEAGGVCGELFTNQQLGDGGVSSGFSIEG